MIARNQNKKVKQAFYLLAFALGMLAMSYAAVPLYKIFCKVTGYGGTPQISLRTTVIKLKKKSMLGSTLLLIEILLFLLNQRLKKLKFRLVKTV